RASHLPVERKPRAARAETQIVEAVAVALHDHASAAGGCVSPQLAAQIAEGEVHGAVAAEWRAARLHAEIQRAREPRSDLRRVEAGHLARERPALGGIPARLTRELRAA